jgi:predicted HicB family RNase H-like nuclease
MDGVVLSQIRLPVGLHRKLKAKADRERRSLNKTMIGLIEAGFDGTEKKQEG